MKRLMLKILPMCMIGLSITPAQAFFNQPLSNAEMQQILLTTHAVQQVYVEDVDNQELVEGALRGMLESLDPHSTYLNKEDLDRLKASTDGEFAGLGIQITKEDGAIKVISPIDDTPAYRAGIEAGDYIVRIDGEPVRNMSLDEAISKMRGEKGTPVSVTVIRPGEAQPLHFDLIRDIIKTESVRHEILDQYYGYIRITNFQATTGEQLKQAIDEMKAETQLRGIVLDMRNNPGGLLDASIAVSDTFLDANKIGLDKKVVYTKGRIESAQKTLRASTPDYIEGIPVVVLVNHGSASASEIVAGALQDHHRAVIVGTQTFGKGSVQTVLPLGKDSAIKITTARYYTPAGTDIQAKGITPDVEIERVEIPYDEEAIRNRALFTTRENGVRGSLQAENISDDDLVAQFSSNGDQPERPLMYRDNQLSEALNILKAISRLERARVPLK